MRLALHLGAVASRAIEAAHGVETPALLRPADPAHGDYQVNGLMALAKRLGRSPRDLAKPVAEALARLPEIEAAEIAGAGFINLRLRTSWLGQALAELASDPARDGVPLVSQPERIVVDYSAPNIAKEMHVGHVRSTILGAALCKMLSFVGHEVLGDNHVGDWGTAFGLLIVGMRRFGDAGVLAASPVKELERLYRLATAEAERDPTIKDEARAELAKLQQGDPENLALWRSFVAATKVELDKVYARLSVTFDLWLGESAYETLLPGVVEQLLASGVARKDDGAVCVFFDDDPLLSKVKTPFIVQKRDGAFLYSTTDVATVLYRRDKLRTERALYVVDKRQKLHFQQLFATVTKLGVDMQLEHVAFGAILGKDGKPLKSREGDVLKLSALLDEAQERAASLFHEEGLSVEPERNAELSRSVGIGAVKYADLSQNRESDYRFDWEKLISLKGNSGPYLQYAHARIEAIFRKGAIEPASLASGKALALTHEAEIALGKQLLRFPDLVHDACLTLAPHQLCEHLYSLARLFSNFYEHCPMLAAEGETQKARLTLAWLTARQLKRGLILLGIDAPDRM